MTYIIDKMDIKILTLLQKDAAVSMDILSERAGLSRNACWRRVKQMEDADVIRGRVVLLDPDAAGVGLLVFVMIRINTHAPDWLLKFEGAVRAMPEVGGAHRMSGELDYILRVRILDVKGYDVFYERLIARVPICDISASFVMDDIKDTTVLPFCI